MWVLKVGAPTPRRGADAHYADPLTDLNLPLSGYGRLASRIKELADLHVEGRLLALGGGGYNLNVVPTDWASAFQILNGEEVREYLPPSWVELFRNEVGGTPHVRQIPSRRWMGGPENGSSKISTGPSAAFGPVSPRSMGSFRLPSPPLIKMFENSEA